MYKGYIHATKRRFLQGGFLGRFLVSVMLGTPVLLWRWFQEEGVHQAAHWF
jgi:hypothetical protein